MPLVYAIDGGEATIYVAVIGAVGAILVGAVSAIAAAITAIAKRNEAKDPLSIVAWTAGQESLIAALEERDKREARVQAATELREAQHDRDMADLRAQVAQMRIELAEALDHARECDEQRVLQDAEIRLLRDRLDGLTT